MANDSARQAGAHQSGDDIPEIVVTPEMVQAGIDELYEHSLSDGLPYLLETVFRAMAYVSPQLQQAARLDTQS
jgi:hypothetical protein